MTNDQILAIYNDQLASLTAAGESGASLLMWACKGTRTRVHEALQAQHDAPVPTDEHDPEGEIHHARQKAHFTRLWQRTDALVAGAGITEEGRNLMSSAMGNTAESDQLKLLFQNTNWANVGDATGLRGSTTAARSTSVSRPAP
jgi:hypothetical protein